MPAGAKNVPGQRMGSPAGVRSAGGGRPLGSPQGFARVGSPGGRHRRAGAGGGNRVDVLEKDIAAVTCFLEEAKGVADLDPTEWDEVLDTRRFSYIERRAVAKDPDDEPALPTVGGSNVPTWEERGLPFLQYSIREMHELLTSGQIPHIQQMQAHVFGPDRVPWPKIQREKQETPPPPPTPPRAEKSNAATGNNNAPQAAAGVLWASVGGKEGGPEGGGPKAAAADGGAAGQNGDEGDTSPKAAAGAAQEKEAAAAAPQDDSLVQLEDEQKEEFARCAVFLKSGSFDGGGQGSLGMRATALAGGRQHPGEEELGGGSGGTAADGDSTGVMLRGQMLRLTAKGAPLENGEGNRPPGVEDWERTLSELSGEDGGDFGKEDRMRMIKEAQLLEYREKKVLEKIKQLKEERDKEVLLQEELTSKERQRRNRMGQLRKKLQERTTEEEERKADEEKRQKEEEVASRKKALEKESARQAAVRRKLEEWQEKKLRGGVPAPSSAAAQKHTPRPPKEKSAKQIEAEEYAAALKAALEQRPPMGELPKRPGARARGYPGAAASAKTPRGGSSEQVQASQREGQQKDEHGDWAAQTKAVSDAYGLTTDEFSQVTQMTERGVVGPGRMATYEK